MSIYNPLQYNNQSFSSRVLDTFKEQEAKKQASLDKMNETLRTEAAQGQLGDLANSILNDALAQASEQGLIGVNQYEIMNKAMPQFYAAKSAVTELNNAYNAELKAAQADDAINVDANFLSYLNDKYYSEGVSLENIDSHTANAISKGFNIAEHSQFLNEEYVLDKVIPLMVKESANSEYGIIGQQADGTNVYGTRTTTGIVRATAETVSSFTQNEQVEALILRAAQKENPNANITSLDLQVSAEDQARLLNNILDKKFPPSSTIQGTAIGAGDQNKLAIKRQTQLMYTEDNIRRAKENEIGDANFEISKFQNDMAAKGFDVSRQEAVEYLLTEKDPDTGLPLHNAAALKNALGAKDQKLTADQRQDLDNQEFADTIYKRDYSTIQSVQDLSGRTVGKLTVGKVYKSGANLVFEVSRGEKDQPIKVLLPMNPNKTGLTAQAEKKLKDLMVNRAIGDQYVIDGGSSAIPTGDKTPPKKVTKSKESGVIDWQAAAEEASGN